MIKLIVTIVVCGSLLNNVHDDLKLGSAIIATYNLVGNTVDIQLGYMVLDKKLNLQERGHLPHSTKKDYRTMVVMRKVLTKSTHPP